MQLTFVYYLWVAPSEKNGEQFASRVFSSEKSYWFSWLGSVLVVFFFFFFFFFFIFFFFFCCVLVVFFFFFFFFLKKTLLWIEGDRRCAVGKRWFSHSALLPSDIGGGCRGYARPPLEMTCGFLIQLVSVTSVQQSVTPFLIHLRSWALTCLLYRQLELHTKRCHDYFVTEFHCWNYRLTLKSGAKN